jgi:hypothetical protein
MTEERKGSDMEVEFFSFMSWTISFHGLSYFMDSYLQFSSFSSLFDFPFTFFPFSFAPWRSFLRGEGVRVPHPYSYSSATAPFSIIVCCCLYFKSFTFYHHVVHVPCYFTIERGPTHVVILRVKGFLHFFAYLAPLSYLRGAIVLIARKNHVLA